MPAPDQSKHRMSPKKAHRLVGRRATKARRSADFGAALGASRSFSTVSRPHGPFGVMALLDELKRRLVSQGGRPADAAPTIRRLVPLRTQVWRELQVQANLLSSLGRHVSPGQLAAVLLERSLSDLEAERQKSPAPSDAQSAQKL